MDFEIGWTGQEICALRQALRLSRIEFARKLGVTRRSVVSWETGRTTTVRAASRRLLYDVLDELDNDQRDRFRAALAYTREHTETTLQHSNEQQLAGFHSAPRSDGRMSVSFGESPEADTLNHNPADDPLRVSSRCRTLSSRGGDDAVERKNFLRLMTGSIAGIAMAGPVRSAVQAATDAHVGSADVVRVRKRARTLARQDHEYGGELSAPGAVAQLGMAAALASGTFASDTVRRDYLSALAELADTTGGVCFDAGMHTEAKEAFQFAVECAIDAEDMAMRAKALTGLANLAVHQNRADDALTYAEMALVRSDLLPPRLSAVIHTRHARALGAVGVSRSRECIDAVLRAEDSFAAEDDRTPDWIAYYDRAHLRRDSGRALLYLSVHGGGNFNDAYARLNSAMAEFPTGFSRGKALASANLATLVMVRDDPHHAVVLGQLALESLGDVHSDRVNHAFSQLRGACDQHVDLPDVAGLREYIRTTVPAAR
ncbi:helix-turn-helix domain-containing protein [Nocardia amamiensis]|uniref:Helix-turn-helix domain-containing protein n=1 Tax=Nocardia amamiensis TaxID=404578 RepID=A0ABS0CV90_9NOCA|nr:helix-turn-helix domain-containing protein [Nocardia amamiensis]MBF6300519.1 helix-turn-helix domain-containing protein [Nocardia amamiensis]